MILDILNQSNYNNYNIELANILGLENSVYISTIISIMSNNKSKLDNDYFLKIDRNKVKKMTTISPTNQHLIDNKLSRIGLIVIRDENEIKLNIDVLFSLFNEDNKDILKEFSKSIKKKSSKEDIIKIELKSCINSTNAELRDAYAAWIDSVIAKQGWMSKKAVEIGQDLIDTYSNRNLDVALKLLDIASIGGYRDIQWAINEYEKNITHNVVKNYKKEVERKIELSTDVF